MVTWDEMNQFHKDRVENAKVHIVAIQSATRDAWVALQAVDMAVRAASIDSKAGINTEPVAKVVRIAIHNCEQINSLSIQMLPRPGMR